jgi:type I restriction enzyme, S subunit
MHEMRNDSLPSGWSWATLGDVADVVKHQMIPDEHPDVQFNYLSIENIKSNSGELVNFAPTSGKDIPSAKFSFTTKDILYNKLRPYLNKVHLPSFDGISATDLIPIRPRDDISREFIAYFLRTREVVEYANQRMRGIQLPRLPVEELLALRIPIPPAIEQRRIASKIEELFLQLNTSRQALQKVPSLMKKFRQSVLATAFRGELSVRNGNDEPANIILERLRHQRKMIWVHETRSKREYASPPALKDSELPSLPDSWIWVALEEMIHPSQPNYGIVKPGILPSTTSGVSYICPDDIIDDHSISTSSLRQTSHEVSQSYKRTILAKGDIILTIRASIGRVAIVPESLAGANLSRGVARLTPLDGIDPVYLAWALRGGMAQEWLQTRARGIALRQINLSDLRRLPIPVAPIAEQERLILSIGTLFAYAEQVERSVKLAAENSDKLAQSIFTKGFRGQLVSQDHNDEPASTLLQRIRKQRGLAN